MKSICSSSSMKNLAVIQICRQGVAPRNYRPTLASWKRFVMLYLNYYHRSAYKTFIVKSSAAFINAV